MAKATVIELNEAIPDTEQNKEVTITITDENGTRTYTGRLTAIITYNQPSLPAQSSVTLSGPGLRTT